MNTAKRIQSLQTIISILTSHLTTNPYNLPIIHLLADVEIKLSDWQDARP